MRNVPASMSAPTSSLGRIRSRSIISTCSSMIGATDRTASRIEALSMPDPPALWLHRAVEAAPIGLRTHPERTTKCESHGLRAAESARDGDLRSTARALFQQTACGLDAHALNETARRHADLTDENSAEIPRAHRCAASQGVH